MDENISALLESKNIAEKLSEEKLQTIGEEAKKGFELDLTSREDWDVACDEWLKLAKQTVDQKSYPWNGASNVKYPLLSTAAMQFAARAYPSLVPSDGKIVKARIIGKDPDGHKTEIAEAVSTYMSYQLLVEMDSWEEEMDKLLIMLPVLGTMFKKTYWDPVKEVNCSRMVLPKNLVVDYWTKSLCDAERISEIIELSPRKVQERIQSGLWLDVKLGDAPQPQDHPDAPANDSITPYSFVEQHTYLDLDDDDYEEPYIVTFQRETGKVVRITARFDEDTIYTDDDGKLQKIEPIQYYTKFGFVPNPDGSFYDIGFGVLLGPLNESVNTLINQLVDSGHLFSLQSGFLGKGLRLRMGETRFQPGEWKVVNATGDDLKKQIVPLPTKEPSNVLFQLMGSLIQSGKELASVAEIFVGKMPGQNTPATTTMASIEQGMKVFTAVYKRIYRSLSEEFQKLYRLNGMYVNPNTYIDVIDMNIGPDIFNKKTHDIFPGADPTAVSQTEKLLKAQGLMELLQTGTLDVVEVVRRVLEAQEQPNYQKLFNQQIQQTGQFQPPPDPKVQALQEKAKADSVAAQQKMAIEQHSAELDARSKEFELQTKAQEAQIKAVAMREQAQLKLHSQLAADQARIAGAQAQAHQQQVQGAQAHQQQMQHNEENHKAQVQATKAMAKAKPQPKKGAK